MSHRDDTERTDGRDGHGVGRRAMLAGLGAAGALATAGCSSLGGGNGGSDEEVDPRWGYVGTGDDDPPVDPDHTVTLQIREREQIPIPEFFFEPTGLAVEAGDTVRFDLATPHHNVNAYHPQFGYNQRVPDGVEPFSSPVLTAGDYWLFTFEEEGVHDIMCAPHELFGMVGRVVVGSATGPGANPVGEAPGSEQSRPPEFTAATVLSDDAMAPDAVLDAGSVSWDDVAAENKRPLLAPVQEGGDGGGSGGDGGTTTNQ